MPEERIYFRVDDSELREATTKLDKSTERVKVLHIRTGKISTRSKSLTRDLDNLEERVRSGSNDLQFLSTDVDETMGQLVQLDLFGNRIKSDTDKANKNTRLLESRLRQLMRRIPIGREAIAIQRKWRALGIAVEGEGAAGLAAAGISAVLLLGVIYNIVRRLDRIQKQMIRDMQGFENEVRQGLDLTYAEFAELDRDVIGFATLWEQLTTRMDDATTEESWDAVADFVIAKIGLLPGLRASPYAPPGGMPSRLPDPQWVIDLKNWWESLPEDSGYAYDANIEVPPGE